MAQLHMLAASCTLLIDASHFNQDEVNEMEAQGIAAAVDMVTHGPQNDKDEEENSLDDEDGMVDVLALMTAQQRTEVEASMRPI